MVERYEAQIKTKRGPPERLILQAADRQRARKQAQDWAGAKRQITRVRRI